MFYVHLGSIVDISTLAMMLDGVKNFVPAVTVILNHGFFSLDNLILLRDHGYIIAAQHSLKEVKHVFSANMREVGSADNNISYNDESTFTLHVDFSIGGPALEGYIYHNMDLEVRERSGFHRHIRNVIDTIEKTKPEEKRLHGSPTSITYVENITDL
ncbi:MAG: hypothetical protein QXU18_03035 [Thermoplasmatales archaeon]